MKYIEVILPLPLPNTFTYAVPEADENSIQQGMRVVVPFGKKKLYSGIVYYVHILRPETTYQIKEIVGILDEEPILRRPQIKFWEWIANYYQAHLGEVYQSALPAGLKLESETLVRVKPDFDTNVHFSEREKKILDVLLNQKKPISLSALAKDSGISNVLPQLKLLLEKDIIEISEQLTEKFHPKTETYIRLRPEIQQDEKLHEIFDQLKSAKKQLSLLMNYIDLSKCLDPKNVREVSRKTLLEKSGISPAVLKALTDKKIFEIYEKIVGRLDFSEDELQKPSILNEFQTKALQEIEKKFKEKPVVLLHGVTSSGKTELYIHLIQKVLNEGKQALYLVPEIALTTQLTARLKRIFGKKLGVYHSKFSDAERTEIWNNLLNDKGYEVIIGVRSSIFLPFRQLGLVIVDEEYETSYKQFDPAPRYHARNAAIVLASMHGAHTLLGSATPAIESYFNAVTGKYGLVKLDRRFEEISLPEIVVVDLKEAYHKKQMNGHFSDLLMHEMQKTLQNREQIILFQNRRGYAPYLECKSCNYIPKCKNCDVSLTYHKTTNALTCHYCGYTESYPASCPVCGTPAAFSTHGFGTEKIEDEIKKIFPEARISRMDLDTTRSRKSYETIITDFEEYKIDILIGTQMITKGLDFNKVSLVGILNADNILNFPDFRSHERAFQLLSQVSGRAGRKDKQGKVILQTYQPKHPIIQQVIANDYEGMFANQCEERKQFKYPPYTRLILLIVRHHDRQILQEASHQLTNSLRSVFGRRVQGPSDPLIPKIQNFYIKHILLKIEIEASPEKTKKLIRDCINLSLSQPSFKSVHLQIDVDPL
ncbi:MAG TPA: primosomal protein N' [Paludibacteraceae bacterium]|nr:primosomal protein N' [Paludibacteraceae bacterium]